MWDGGGWVGGNRCVRASCVHRASYVHRARVRAACVYKQEKEEEEEEEEEKEEGINGTEKGKERKKK